MVSRRARYSAAVRARYSGALSVRKVITGAGVGVLDIVTETVDKQQGFTKPWQNISDIVRIGATVVGYLMAAFSKSKVGGVLQDVALAYTPLAIRTIYQNVSHVALAGQRSFGGYVGQPAGFSVVRAGQSYGAHVPPPVAPPATVPNKSYRSFVPG